MPTPELTQDAIRVEADTAEQALVLVREQLGDDAEILEARKVHRGGWKGFFALERVEMTARAGGIAPARSAEPDVTSARRQLEEEEARDRADFDRMLRQLLEPETAAAPEPASAPEPESAVTAAPEPAPAPEPARAPDPEPVPAPEPAPVSQPVTAPPSERARLDRPAPASRPSAGGVRWSVQALEALRLPAAMIEACADLPAGDDAAWVMALADVATPWCRPLPTGLPAYVGPQVARLAAALDVPVARVGAVSTPAGAVALEAPDTAEGRGWAADRAGDRWLHAVVGGRRWHGFMFEDVLAVSWVGDDQLPAALSVAHRMGLVLGYGMGRSAGSAVRATPVDVALTIRGLMPRDDH